MCFSKLISRTALLSNQLLNPRTPICYPNINRVRKYSYGSMDKDGCAKAHSDLQREKDPVCDEICERKEHKKQGILHKIKLKVLEGGSNFGTPFRRVKCDPKGKAQTETESNQTETKQKKSKAMKSEGSAEEKLKNLKALPAPFASKKDIAVEDKSQCGVQVSILGADTAVGQFVALLLKQCPAFRKLRLYEAQDTSCGMCNRELCQVVHDLQHIDTNCMVEAFSCSCADLNRCLQNTDIVLILESGYVNAEMSLEKRFMYQAPIVKGYADAIAAESPNAFIIVCSTPIDCMVPLIAQTLKETNWYNPKKLLGSMAVPEMRASTVAARALHLEPRYIRVPCVGGTEGDSLVPLFSKAVDYFDFSEQNSDTLTKSVRAATSYLLHSEGNCPRAADLSEAHAIAGLVIKVAHALLCNDVSRVTGYVETDNSQILSPANFMAIDVLLNHKGICKQFDFPFKMTKYELDLLVHAFSKLVENVEMANVWHSGHLASECMSGKYGMRKFYHLPRDYDHVKDCNVYLSA